MSKLTILNDDATLMDVINGLNEKGNPTIEKYVNWLHDSKKHADVSLGTRERKILPLLKQYAHDISFGESPSDASPENIYDVAYERLKNRVNELYPENAKDILDSMHFKIFKVSEDACHGTIKIGYRPIGG